MDVIEKEGSGREQTFTCTNCTVQVHSETNIMGVRCIRAGGARTSPQFFSFTNYRTTQDVFCNAVVSDKMAIRVSFY